MWFKKKINQVKKAVFNAEAFEITPKEIKVSEPQTLAQYRLLNGAKDAGSAKGVKMYNAHKAKIQNQWINPLQSINSGYGNSQLSYYNYQAVNYYECYALAQDPLFNKIFNLLSNTPFANGGDVVADLSEKDAKLLDEASNKYKVIETITKCVRSNYVCGGCLLYLDFGDEYDLEEPLDLKKVDMDDFKGFRHIDPINITAVDVNTIDPSKADYMSPKIWYVIGLGAVHASHFLKFEDNIPELMMKPMCLYFGMPLTLLIKQDVANSNLASQGLANLMNRFRYLYLQTSDDNFTSSNAVEFRQRLETMSMIQDNFGIYPIKSTEQIQQFTTALTGMDKNAEFFYQIIASKTDITLSVLLGKGAQGLSGTLEGERKNWYDRVRTIQQQNKHNLLVMMGIAYGKEKDGKFVEFADYAFNPLEQSNEKEKAENLRSYTEVAKSLIEVGVKTEDVLNWLKGFKDFHLDNIELDDEAEDMEGFDEQQQGIGTSVSKSENAEWIESEHPRDKLGQFTEKDENNETAETDFNNEILNSIEKDISKLNYEEGAIIDNNGNLVKGFKGNEDAILIMPEDTNLLNGAIFTHNHPNNTVFSKDDLFTCFGKAKAAELRVVTPDGIIYSLKPQENADITKLLPNYTQTDLKARRLYKEKVDREIKMGIITPEEALNNWDDVYFTNDRLLKFFREKAKDYGFIFSEKKLS